MSDTGESAPLAGFAEQLPVLDVGGDPLAGVGESAAVQRSVDVSVNGAAMPMVQRSVDHTSIRPDGSRPAVQRSDVSSSVVRGGGPEVAQSPVSSTGPRAGSTAVQRLVGDTPSLQVLSRSDSTVTRGGPGSADIPGGPVAQRLVEAAPGQVGILTRAAFAEPAVQRLVGSAQPIVQRTAQAPASSEPVVVQRPQPVATLPVAVTSTAASPVVQAAPEVHAAPQPVEQTRTADPAPSQEPVQRTAEAAPQPAAPQQGTPEELLRKLYDPLLRRLKADLWLDRERRGALTDL